jgi:hypothetical protein
MVLGDSTAGKVIRAGIQMAGITGGGKGKPGSGGRSVESGGGGGSSRVPDAL